jgi:hypothetical protein
MTEPQTSFREEIVRIRKVADMLCTGHANLRDRFARWSLILDLLILAASTWLVALAFVDPALDISLTPFGLGPRLLGRPCGGLHVFPFGLAVAG